MEPIELVEELQYEHVTEARVIEQTRNGVKSKTNSIILTFGLQTLPDSIRVCYQKIKVRPFIPNPLRCFKCQKFGHHQSMCRVESICAKCSLPSHGESPCTAAVKCSNCSGDHPSYSPTCPKWQEEKEVCRIKVTNNVTYPEARKLLIQPLTSTVMSYAAAVTAHKDMKRTIATQTEVTNCTCKPSVKLSEPVQTVASQTDTEIATTLDEEEWQSVPSRKPNKEGTGRRLSDPSLKPHRSESVRDETRGAAAPDLKKFKPDAVGATAPTRTSGSSTSGQKPQVIISKRNPP